VKKIQLIKTGIQKLDDFLGGGLLIGSITFFWTQPGVANAPFAYQVLNKALEEDYTGVYITQTKATKAVENEIKDYGWDLGKYKTGKFKFMDAYSSLVKADSKEEYVIDAKDIKEFTKALENLFKNLNNTKTIVIFDSLSTIIDNCGEGCINEIIIWKKLFKEHNAAGIFLFTEWLYDKELLKKLRDIADAIVQLKAIEEKVILREYFTVSKIKGGKPVKRGIPFKIVLPGGVRIYIPKILVTGPFNAGKTSFIHSASTRAVSVDRFGTTIALDHGHVDHAGFAVDLFGTPGQERFDPILKLLGGEALGVILVIDSTNQGGFFRAKEMLEKTRTQGLPTVVVANKANLKGSLSVNEIRKKMKLPKDIPMVPVVAQNLSLVKKDQPCQLKKNDVKKVLDELFERVV